MRTFVDGNLTVVAPDFGAWLQEKNVLSVHVDGGGTFVLRKNDNDLATYTLDTDGNAIVDVSDVLRVGVLPCSLYVTTAGGRTTGAIPFMRAGLINPLHVLIPESESGLRMQIPSVAYEPIVGSLFSTEFLSLEDNIGVFGAISEPLRLVAGEVTPYSFTQHITLGRVSIAELLQEHGMHAGPYTFNFDGHEEGAAAPYRWVSADGLAVYTKVRNPKSEEDLSYTDQEAQSVYYVVNGEFWDVDTLQNIVLRKMECGKRYAAVRWVSFTGNERVHTFEVVKSKMATKDSVSLLTIDGSHNTIKGREDGFGLRIDGLGAYDMWYYADVITSSRVEVSFDGLEWQQVDVLTKDVTVPDGNAGKANTIEISVNWRKYDAITL